MTPIEVMMREYETLRLEIQDSIRLQHTTFGVGGSVLIFIQSLSESQSANNALRYLILALPPLAYLVVALWLVEMARMMRAGNYLRLLEVQVNCELDGIGLQWESWLRSQTPTKILDSHRVHYWGQLVVVGLILVIAIIGIVTIASSQDIFRISRWVFVGLYSVFFVAILPPVYKIVGHRQIPDVKYRADPDRLWDDYQKWRQGCEKKLPGRNT